MRMVRADAAQRCKESLEKVKSESAAWRVQIYRFAVLKSLPLRQTLDQLVADLIPERLAEREGWAFFCEDGDVVLLGKSLTTKQCDEITGAVLYYVPREMANNPASLVSPLYDLGVSWHEVEALCQVKLAALAPRIAPDAPRTAENGTGLTREDELKLVRGAMAQREARRQTRSRACVLLVEDDQLTLHLARKTLTEDVSVITASNASEARNAYIAHAPDVVFLDIGLPDMSGHQLLTELRKLDPSAYIVMLSGNSFRDDIIKAMQHGAKGFVGKPFSRGKLLHYIGHATAASLPALASVT